MPINIHANISALGNDDHYRFHTRFCELVKAYDSCKLLIAGWFETYLGLYGQHEKALNKLKRKALFAKYILKQSRAKLDRIYIEMAMSINGGIILRSDNSLYSDIARDMNTVIDDFCRQNNKE